MADLLPAYLIVGADELKRDAAVRRLRSHVPADMADSTLTSLTAPPWRNPVSSSPRLRRCRFAQTSASSS